MGRWLGSEWMGVVPARWDWNGEKNRAGACALGFFCAQLADGFDLGSGSCWAEDRRHLCWAAVWEYCWWLG